MMSDLQLSLLVIGAVVVGAVYCYNWMQERGLRRRMQQAFGTAHDDVLLKGGGASALADGRLEPQLAPRQPPADRPGPDPGHSSEPGSGHEAAASGFDAVLDYVAEIDSDGPISDALTGELTGRVAARGKPVRLAGLDARSGGWEEMVRGKGGRYRALRLSLQLVSRTGAGSAAQLAGLCDAVRGCAGKVPAAATCPVSQAALKSARDLDAFCAEVD